MTTINLSDFCVLDDNGNVNVDETVVKFEEVLNQYQSSVQSERNTIRTAINTVFDKNRGSALKMKVLQQLTLQHMNAQNENYTTLNERVRLFIRNSPEFHVGRGNGGGVTRVADQENK